VHVLLAHAGDVPGNAALMTAIIAIVLAATWIVLGVVCWIFWRAKKRDDADRKTAEWKNAPSS
jgi:heme/copper-type cytochrome/quinol oxidase subunit 2